MDARQDATRNPFGMDEHCRNCGRCETRERVVHGYGDVGADFVFVTDAPSRAAEEAGVPLVGDDAGRLFQRVLRDVGLVHSDPDDTEPDLGNAFVTCVARCRDDHSPTRAEAAACEPFLNAELRMINPEIIVPVGERALDAVAEEYTTTPASDLTVRDHHATSVRGRGFELFPMVHPRNMTGAEAERFVDAFRDLLDRDYRQTKGRRKR